MSVYMNEPITERTIGEILKCIRGAFFADLKRGANNFWERTRDELRRTLRELDERAESKDGYGLVTMDERNLRGGYNDGA